ncbi:helix-turn-helix domain-containing protein [Dehalobacter restrictus]|uniref:Helix-turn-helix domain-containing protein n=1 Tax=Dehalobacter restrictus TaxID=55583 RepID=A0A857DG89_9FIRM|nr:helix-turn-helix domain-containing protein [Dehalobacter restrictus]QGZ99294.1 hypothetical protein GQ588_00710 [Dehalobacter restrictus]
MSDYSFLIDRYPEFITKDQFYKICHISKNTAHHYLENGFIPCIDSGKKTRRYKIALKDIIFFLEDRDKNPEKYYLPNHYNNPFLPSEIRQYKAKPRPDTYKYAYKLKGLKEVKNYQKYLEQQFADYPDMLTRPQVQQITGYSVDTILLWCKSGKVRYIRHHNAYLLQKKSVIDYIFNLERKQYTD